MNNTGIATLTVAATSGLPPHAAAEARLHTRSHVARCEPVALGQDASKTFENEHE